MNKKPASPSNEPGYEQSSGNQLIPKKGEEYLREVANIEDMPSPAEDEEAQRVIKESGENEDQKQNG